VAHLPAEQVPRSPVLLSTGVLCFARYRANRKTNEEETSPSLLRPLKTPRTSSSSGRQVTLHLHHLLESPAHARLHLRHAFYISTCSIHGLGWLDSKQAIILAGEHASQPEGQIEDGYQRNAPDAPSSLSANRVEPEMRLQTGVTRLSIQLVSRTQASRNPPIIKRRTRADRDKSKASRDTTKRYF
jgi:hypothetical protein